VTFATLEPLECFVNSIAALAVILEDIFPANLAQDAFETAALLLYDAAEALAAFTGAIDNSKLCNTSGDVLPKIANPNTGIPAVDTLLSGLTTLINDIGANGPFGKIASSFVTGICSTNSSSEIQTFANEILQFVSSVSIPNFEARIFEVVFDAISKVSNGLAQFGSMDLNVPPTCNVNTSQACALVTNFGQSYLQCVQQQINSGALSLTIGITLGEHWLPPSITGWAIGIGCLNLDCWSCILGLKSGAGTFQSIISLLVNDIMGTKNDENTRVTCPQNATTQALCTPGGTWDTTACACRCSGTFIASNGGGCQLCPSTAAGVCNNKGACYNNGTSGPACCCTGTVTTVNCA